MDSSKVGSPGASGLSNNPGIRRSKAVNKDLDTLVGPKDGSGDDKADFNVNLSTKAKEMAQARSKAMEIARNTPDIREDKVADLKKRIESGEYKADAGHIADGMMREAIRDELAKNPPEM